MRIKKLKVVDLRKATREDILSLGDPGCGWKDKKSGEVWPAIKIRERIGIIHTNGQFKEADPGDYIVRTSEGMGTVSYFAHETQWGVEPLWDNPPVF